MVGDEKFARDRFSTNWAFPRPRAGLREPRANPTRVNRICSVTAISVLLLGAVASPVSGRTVQEPLERVLVLRAEFDVGKKGAGFTNYVVGAEQRANTLTGEVHLEKAWVYRDQCEGRPANVPRHCYSDTGGRGRLIRFEISNDFNEATLVLRYRGEMSRVRFTSTEKPVPYPDLFANSCGALGFMVFADFRYGEAEGRVMGRHVSRAHTSDHEFAPTLLSDSICL